MVMMSLGGFRQHSKYSMSESGNSKTSKRSVAWFALRTMRACPDSLSCFLNIWCYPQCTNGTGAAQTAIQREPVVAYAMTNIDRSRKSYKAISSCRAKLNAESDHISTFFIQNKTHAKSFFFVKSICVNLCIFPSFGSLARRQFDVKYACYGSKRLILIAACDDAYRKSEGSTSQGTGHLHQEDAGASAYVPIILVVNHHSSCHICRFWGGPEQLIHTKIFSSHSRHLLARVFQEFSPAVNLIVSFKEICICIRGQMVMLSRVCYMGFRSLLRHWLCNRIRSRVFPCLPYTRYE